LDLAAVAAVVGVVGAVVVVVVLGGGLPRLLELDGFLPLAFGVVEDFAVVGLVEDFEDADVEDFAVDDGVAAVPADGTVVVVDDADAAWACVIWM
jgi:hypothetical protein